MVVMVTLRSAATNATQVSEMAEPSVFVKAYVTEASVHELDPVYKGKMISFAACPIV